MMTPPTAAPGSVAVMRRQGTAHDAGPSAFYVPSPLQQQNSMGSHQQDGSVGNNKPKKSWGERLKLGKSEKPREERQQPPAGVSSSPDNNNYLLQEYRNKYGTLSSGSALSKSMKYAETWLYGSVAVRPQPNGSTPRPSLFLYHHPTPPVTVIPASQVVIPPGTNYAVVMCSCPEFLTGTARGKKSSSAVCKKCGGSRMLWNINKGGGTVRAASSGGTVRGMNPTGTVRGLGGTLRLGGGSSGQNRVRPSLLNLTTTPNPKPPPQQPLKATTPDPYDLMRRNRLGGVNNNENTSQHGLMDTNVQFSRNDTLRIRAKSTSPCRRKARRSPSPPMSTAPVLNHSHPESGSRMSRKDTSWGREYSNWNSPTGSIEDNNKRKSILECDVTAYELIAKYLKNGSRLSAENCDAKKTENKSNNVDVSDDDVLDDDLSDDLSDNALENSSDCKSTVPRNQINKGSKQNILPLHPKTDSSIKAQQNMMKSKVSIQASNKRTNPETQSVTSPARQGLTLGGQRIRLFNESSGPSAPEENNSYLTEGMEFVNVSEVSQNNNKDTGNHRVPEGAPKNATTSSSMIPRLASPRRPPRKLKSPDTTSGCGDRTVQETGGNEIESATSSGGANSSNNNTAEAAECGPSISSQAKDARSPSTAEGVCIIKSILKKPSILSPGETLTSLKTFGDTISKPDASAAASSEPAAASGQYSPSPEAAGSGSTNFYLPTFQEFKQQNRKKKQVQFKVANDVLQPLEEELCDNNLDSVDPARNSVATPESPSPSPPPPPPPVEERNYLTTNNRQSSVRLEPRNSPEDNDNVRYDRRSKDVRFAKEEEKQIDYIQEKSAITCEVKDDSIPPYRDKTKLNQLVNDNDDVKKQECDTESVKFQYFGEGDVAVVNYSKADNVSSCGGAIQGSDKDKGDSDAADASPLPDDPLVLGGTAAHTGDLLVERSNRGGYNLRRSQSERLLPTTSGSLRGGVPAEHHEHLCADGTAALFNDTMRLRLRPGRPDIRQVFSDPGAPGNYISNENGAPRRPQRMLSPGRPRPKEPPPPPPPPSLNGPENSLQPLPELPPRQIFPFTKKQIEQMNQQARQFSLKSKVKQRDITNTVPSTISKLSKSSLDFDSSTPSNIRPVSWSPLVDTSPTITKETLDVVKKKEHRHSDPGPIAPKLVVHVENSADNKEIDSDMQTDINSVSRQLHRYDMINLDDRNSLPKMSSKIHDNKGCTIVTVSSAPGSPLADVHRLQIRAEDPIKEISPISQRRTSILINSEDFPEVIRRRDFGSDGGGNSSTTSVLVKENSVITSPVKNDSTSNKVTISVGGDPMLSEIKARSNINLCSSCTIIDTSPPSTINLSKVYNKANCSSLTVLSSSPSEINVIPVHGTQVQRTLLVVEPIGKDESLHIRNEELSSTSNNDNNIKIINNSVTTIDKDAVQGDAISNVILTPKSRGTDVISTSSDVNDEDALMNPVEAVRRNLVPHVCGKKDTADDDEDGTASSPTERLNKLIEMNEEEEEGNEQEKMKEGDYCMAAATSTLVDTSVDDEDHIYSNLSPAQTLTPKSSEDTLPTVVEQEEVGDDDVFMVEDETDVPSFLQGNSEECRTQDSSLSITDLSSECDTAPSSIEPEKEGIATIGEVDNMSTSYLPLSLPPDIPVPPESEKDDQENEVELRNHKDGSCSEIRSEAEEENIYETIRDPIYEEIPDTPPPLPLSPPPSLDDLDESKRSSRSIFEGASKYDILSYLVGAKERGIVPEESYYGGSTNGDEIIEIIDGKPSQDDEDGGQSHQRMTSLDLGDLSSRVSHLSNASDSSEDSCNLIISNISDTPSSPNKIRKSSAEIERNDSGVGSETSKSSRSRWQHCGPASSIREDQQHLCEDCDQPVETQVTDCGVMFAPLVCRKCGKKRAERKEIIAEIVETEEKYGRDLQIIMEEFYRPMLVAGLLTPEQLQAIFLNVEELLEHNAALAEKLRDNLEIAVEQGDEDLLTVNIGKLFLEAAPMLHAFESYCVRQGAASLLLANLEKEKELLRIFLRVSQMENTVLRRMNLNSFLMVPVQRVTKYPLLLARLHKVTPAHHEGRELLRQAQHKIELHLEHMNSEAKDISTTKLWRRISIMNGRRSSSETDMLNIKLRKMALDILEWNHDEVRFAMEGKLLYTNPADNNWRKGRTIKLNPINALLVTNGKPTEDYRPDPTEDALMFPRKTGVREATLLLLKEKCGRYTQLREPLFLDRCIVCCEAEWEDYFEVQELASKDTFIFKAEDGDRTKLWYRQLQYHAQGLGAWRRRRNALANIMINGMQTRN